MCGFKKKVATPVLSDSGFSFTVRELVDIARYIYEDRTKTVQTTKRFKYLTKFQEKVNDRLKEITFDLGHSR